MCNWIGWLILGALAGWAASKIMGTGKQQGLVMDIVVGIIGAFVGGFVLSLFGFNTQATGLNIPSFFVALIGAIVLLFALRLIRRNS
jgi:uncharacterized membrane protein YeaQ/YmgE (transglycosylase-associated protein family)